MKKAQLFVAVQLVLFAVFVAAASVLPVGGDATLRGIGLLLMAMAGALLLLAVLAHNATNRRAPNITPTPQHDAALVTTGVYQRVRHPIYTAVLTGTLGAAMAHGAAGLFVVWGVLVIFFWVKSRYEETLLCQKYPDYADYQARSSRFIPFIW